MIAWNIVNTYKTLLKFCCNHNGSCEPFINKENREGAPRWLSKYDDSFDSHLIEPKVHQDTMNKNKINK